MDQGIEITKKVEDKEMTLVWLEDSPEFDQRVSLPSLGELTKEVIRGYERLYEAE